MSVLPIESKRATAYALTDLGNGERFAARHGKDVRWIDAGKKWLVWDGKRWAFDSTRGIDRMAKETVRSIWMEAIKAESESRKSDIAKHAMASERSGSIKAMLDRAGAEVDIPIVPADLDADPFRFTVRNGTIDLRTGQLGAHDRTHLITKVAPVTYDATAASPRWAAFLDRVFGGDSAIIAYIQRAVGYSLTGDVKEQVLHILHGSGMNGKSVFMETIARLLGDYAIQADFATFLDHKGDGPRNDVARLAGARLVRSSEIGEGKRLDEALVKALTGNEIISARFLYHEAFEFPPTFKIWLSANHKPVIRGTDWAIWRRVRLVPFDVTIPEAERDDALDAKLRTELPGILNWALAGCVAWLDGGLRPPAGVLAATAAYRNESDVLGSFLDECCELDRSAQTAAGDLYTVYKRWAKDAGEFEMSQTAFGRKLEDRGVSATKKHGVKYRTGLRLTVAVPTKPTDRRGWHDT